MWTKSKVMFLMLFHRQRLLLTLLDTLGEPTGRTDFQKLLFLYTHEYEESPSYEFYPIVLEAFLLHRIPTSAV